MSFLADSQRSDLTPPPMSTSSSGGSTPSSPTTAGRPMRSPVAPSRPLPATPPADGIVTGIQLPTGPLQTPQKASVAAPSITSNPFNVDIVIPFDISNSKADGSEISADYTRLINALENEGGLRVTARPGRAAGGKTAKGCEEVWVFVGVTDGKVAELEARERIVDQAHGMRIQKSSAITPATRLRLAYELLTSPALQHGLGITPGAGDWSRVKAIVALHDDDTDKAWLEHWTIGGDWKIGLLRGLGEQNGDMLGRNQTPEVRLYFNFLSMYTLSLLPITVVALGFWLKCPADSYPPAFAFCLSLYACTFIAVWRIRQRKLAVRWGTYGCEQVSVQLRPQYVRSHGVTRLGETTTSRWEHIRDAKVIASIPIILGCGFLLACVLSTIFLLEAFVGHVYSGPGKAALPYLPMALFSLVVPQVVTLFNSISARLVDWEDHPTFTSATKSLTAKTFAMNMIVAYSGLFLTAYVYLPFGPYLMAYVHNVLAARNGGNFKESAPHHHHAMINVGRLKGQIFAYMVTNQVINTFLEVGLPYVLRFVNDFREGKVSFKDLKGNEKRGGEFDPEARFLDKVAHELTLPPYNIFTDYAEMVTQFGYVVAWGTVWPLAPLFALVNNYFELRSDAVKICKHVRRPIGGRVESIGTWLNTMGVLAWVGAWASTTLVYLFRPSTTVLGKANRTLAATLAHYEVRPSIRQVLPYLMPVALAALAASHGFFALRAIITAVAERVLWRGSPEQIQLEGAAQTEALETRVDAAIANEKSLFSHSASEKVVPDAFWNGTEAGTDEIRRVGKAE